MPHKSNLNIEVAKAFLLLLLLALCPGCFGPAPSVQFVQQAQRLHDGALASAVTSDSDLRDYVQLVGRRIADAAHAADPGKTHDPLFSQMEFHLVGCPVPNTFTTGGAHIYVYSGLFQVCQSEDELAIAIAHAFAHQMNLDVEHVEMQPDPNNPLPPVAWQFVSHRFSLSQEQAADRLALDVLVRAGYDPKKAAALFEQLANAYPAAQAPDRTPLLVRSQDARQGAQRVNASRRPLPVADPRTFTSLRRQAASLNGSQAKAQAQLFLRAFPNCILAGDTADQQAAQTQLRPPPPVRKLEPS